jgi:4-carboxymuconolactone decarboxylase
MLLKTKQHYGGSVMSEAAEMGSAAAQTGRPRIAALEPPYQPEVAETLAKWMPPGSDVEPLALFRTLVVHERLAQRMRPLGAGILGSSALVPPPLRELMIDRTCALTGAQYEWGVHVAAFAASVGLSEEQVRSTVQGGSADACWSEEQALVVGLADELHATSAISDELWRALAERFEEAQIIELIVTAGWYHLIAFLCNGLRVPLESWGARFPGEPTQ